MRQKTRLPLRRTRRRTQPVESTSDWVIENELGWGLPHAAIALVAIVIVAIRVLGWERGRLETWLARRTPSGEGADDG